MRAALLWLSLIASVSFASTTPEQAQRDLENALSQRTRTLWSCERGGEPEAVSLFALRPGTSVFLGGPVLTIRDEAICAELQVTCPFVAKATPSSAEFLPATPRQYWATRGKSEDTVMLYSEHDGMKIVRAHNGSTARPQWDRNWFFHDESCVFHAK